MDMHINMMIKGVELLLLLLPFVFLSSRVGEFDRDRCCGSMLENEPDLCSSNNDDDDDDDDCCNISILC